MKICSLTGMIIILLCSGIPSFSQIMFQNKNREAVDVAFARYVNNGTEGIWVTKGWSRIGPSTTVKVFDAIGANDSIGFFAITRISETPYPGTRNLLVLPIDQFLIKNADQESVLEKYPEYEWRQFRLIRLQPGKTSGTISFTN